MARLDKVDYTSTGIWLYLSDSVHPEQVDAFITEALTRDLQENNVAGKVTAVPQGISGSRTTGLYLATEGDSKPLGYVSMKGPDRYLIHRKYDKMGRKMVPRMHFPTSYVGRDIDSVIMQPSHR